MLPTVPWGALQEAASRAGRASVASDVGTIRGMQTAGVEEAEAAQLQAAAEEAEAAEAERAAQVEVQEAAVAQVRRGARARVAPARVWHWSLQTAFDTCHSRPLLALVTLNFPSQVEFEREVAEAEEAKDAAERELQVRAMMPAYI